MVGNGFDQRRYALRPNQVAGTIAWGFLMLQAAPKRSEEPLLAASPPPESGLGDPQGAFHEPLDRFSAAQSTHDRLMPVMLH